MSRIVLIVFLTILSGCVSTKKVGGYDIYGTVVDFETGEAMEGVYVSAYFSAVGPFGDKSRSLASTFTDKSGGFVLSVPPTRLWGGLGLSGHVGEWPMINYSKQGYCQSGILVQDPTLDKYQGMLLRLQEKVSGGCI